MRGVRHVTMLLSVELALGLGLGLAACSDDPHKRPLGSTCEASDECADGLCLAGKCLDPEADEDLDGLINRIEGTLGTDPFSADTDHDGASDPDEINPDFTTRDADGDGKSDAIESSTADADRDCIADQEDPHDDAPDRTDPRVADLITAACPVGVGVCGAEGATLGVTCDPELEAPSCEFGAVPGHEAEEAACDGEDNDCDGATDEAAGCGPSDPLDVGLIGRWPLDGDGQDVGPHHDDGVVSGATAVPDRFGAAGKAMRFAATGDRVTVATTHHPLGEVTVSYSAWVKLDDDAGAAAGVLAFGDVLVPQQRSSLVLWGARSCLEYTGEQNDFDAPTACAPDGHWTFVAAVKTGRHVKLYMDGRLHAEGELAEGQALASTHLEIGLSKRQDDGWVYEQLHGAIDDVRAWSRALTDAEIASLYHEGGWTEIGTKSHPGASCLHVRDAGQGKADGLYWLDPQATGTAVQAYCDMSTDGGGWTLVWVYGFTAPGDFRAPPNAVTPVPSWRGSNIDVPVSTTPPTSPTTRGAVEWSQWAALGNEVLLSNTLLDTIACRPGRGSLADGTSGDVQCRVIADKTSECDGVLPGFLWWGVTGPSFSAQSLWLYFDGATDINWPTHDPCGVNTKPLTAPADAGGAVWLRPSDSLVRWPDTCGDVLAADRAPSVRIDPDGPGGHPPFTAQCDFQTERGGWTRLDGTLYGILQGAPETGPLQYLLKKDGAWYRSPATFARWTWDRFDEVPGPWVYDGVGGEGLFDCEGGATGGWGVGCGGPETADPRVLPGAGATPGHNEELGGTSVCQAPPDAFGVGGNGCTGQTSVWIRGLDCMPDAGSVLGDGDFAALAASAPGDPPGCWAVNGHPDRFAPDWEDVPPGGTAPSITAANPELGNLIYDTMLAQRDFTLMSGHSYRLGFWAKAAEPRSIRVFVQNRDLSHHFYWEDVDLGTEWAYYDLGFSADATAYDAMLDLQLGEVSTATVWLDDVSLRDEGATPCVRHGSELVMDGGFDAGRTCWSFGHDTAMVHATAMPDGSEGGVAPPSIAVEQTPGATDDWRVNLTQRGVPLLGGHHYRLAVSARAAAPRPLTIGVVNETTAVWRGTKLMVGTTWQRHVFDFLTPVDGTTGAGRIDLNLAGTADDLWVDDVSLVDLGANPCTPDGGSLVADGGFAAGTACWEFGYDQAALFAEAQPDPAVAPEGDAPSLRVVHAPGAAETWRVSLRQTGLPIVAGHWYRLTYKARAASPRSVVAAVGTDDGKGYTWSEQPLTTAWRAVEQDFQADEAGTAWLAFQLASPTAAAIWLDDVRLEDVGADPCLATGDGDLVGDGGFDHGPLCWSFGFDPSVTIATATSSPSIPGGSTAPSLMIEQTPGSTNLWEVGIGQAGLTIDAGRWYRLALHASAEDTRTVAAMVSDDTTMYFYREMTLLPGWRPYSYDFATSVASAAGASHLSFQLGGSAIPVWFDSVSLTDLGPTPCVSSPGDFVRDGELTGGLLCWFPPSPLAAYEASDDHAPATAAPSLAVTNTTAGDNLWDAQLIQRGYHIDQGKDYTLRFWARAAAPRTIVALVHNWDTNIQQTYQVVEVGTQWQQYVFDFTGETTEDNVLLELQFGGASVDTVWVDGLHLGPKSGVPTAGLVAYYPFSANAGDASGHGNDGAVHGATLTADMHAVPNAAYQFDGASNYIQMPTTGWPLGGADRTIAFWMRPDSAGPSCGGTGASVVQYGQGDCVGKMFGAGFCQSSWYFWGGCYDAWPTSSSDPGWQAAPTGEWSFVAMRLAGGILTVRVNDTVQTVARDTLDTQAGDAFIGAETGSDGAGFRAYFKGAVDEVRVYDRALDDAELQAIFVAR